MASSLQQRFKINLEEGLNEGRNVMVKVAMEVTGKVPVKERFDRMSNTEKSKIFNREQIMQIQSNMPIHQMDVSLLDIIIKVFGGLSPCPLTHLLKQLKNERNRFAHERHRLSLTKDTLKSELAKFKTLYTSILEELKKHCLPDRSCFIDQDIAFTQAQLLLLEKTLDDNLQEKAEDLVTATANAAYAMAQLTERAKVQQDELFAKLNDRQEQMITKLKEETKVQQEQIIEENKVQQEKFMDALHKGVEASLKRIEEMKKVQQENIDVEDMDAEEHGAEQSRTTTTVMQREDGQVTEPRGPHFDIRAAAGYGQDRGFYANCNVTVKYQSFAGATLNNPNL